MGAKKCVYDLEAVASRLKSATDRLTAAIADLDERLGEIGMDIDVWVRWPVAAKGVARRQGGCRAVRDDSIGQGWEVGYARVGESWHLAARQVSWTMDAKGNYFDSWIELSPPVRLVTAPVAVRREAARYLDRIVQNLQIRGDETIEAIARALDELASRH